MKIGRLTAALNHFEMNIAMSQIANKYGINVSLWYPACNPADIGGGCPKGDFHDPAVMAAGVKDYHSILGSMPRVDTLFVSSISVSLHVTAC